MVSSKRSLNCAKIKMDRCFMDLKRKFFFFSNKITYISNFNKAKIIWKTKIKTEWMNKKNLHLIYLKKNEFLFWLFFSVYCKNALVIQLIFFHYWKLSLYVGYGCMNYACERNREILLVFCFFLLFLLLLKFKMIKCIDNQRRWNLFCKEIAHIYFESIHRKIWKPFLNYMRRKEKKNNDDQSCYLMSVGSSFYYI